MLITFVIISVITATLFIILLFRRYRRIFQNPNKVLRVLMYHKLSDTAKNDLTVFHSDFDAQLLWLKQNGFNSISCKELFLHLTENTALPPNPILITFDDGYVNNLDFGLPLLNKYGMKATIFLPVQHIGGRNVWDEGNEELMNAETIRLHHGKGFEFALHSYAQINYRFKSISEVEADLDQMFETLTREKIPYFPAFAYPYGGLPKDANQKKAVKSLLNQRGIHFAFRIKDKHNPLPIRDSYELLRVGISGADSLEDFAYRVRYGSKNLL